MHVLWSACFSWPTVQQFHMHKRNRRTWMAAFLKPYYWHTVWVVLPWGPRMCQLWAWCCSYSNCTDFSWLEKEESAIISQHEFIHKVLFTPSTCGLACLSVCFYLGFFVFAADIFCCIIHSDVICFVCLLTAERQKTSISDRGLTQVQNLQTGQVLR